MKPITAIVMVVAITIALAGIIFIMLEDTEWDDREKNVGYFDLRLYVVVNDKDIVYLEGINTEATKGYIFEQIKRLAEYFSVDFIEGIAYIYGSENLTEEFSSIDYCDCKNGVFVVTEKAIQISKMMSENNTYLVELKTYVPMKDVIVFVENASIGKERKNNITIDYMDINYCYRFSINLEGENTTLYVQGYVIPVDMIFEKEISLTNSMKGNEADVKVVQYDGYWFKIYSMPDGRIIIRVFDSNWNEVARDVIRVEG